MRVRIYKPSKTAMQSGLAKTKNWVLEYETTSPRRPESLMGWTASKDTLNQVKLRFFSKEDAIKYARNKGWEYVVVPDHKKKIVPRNYNHNFVFRGSGSDQ